MGGTLTLRERLTGLIPMEICEEKYRLTCEYQTACESYAHAVCKLLNELGITQSAEYQCLRTSADEFRLYSDRMRLNLERHIAEHGC
jgi:hypothetical protein